MVRPSHPRLMARVLDAVANLGDTRGSSAREILSFIQQSNVSSKNLTVQVHRALKHAVNAALLRHRSGRYKVLATLNPTSAPVPSTGKEPVANDPKAEEKKLNPDRRAPLGDAESSRRRQERKKKTTSRRQSSKRRSSNARKKSRRSPHNRRSRATVQTQKRRRQRKRSYENEEFEDQSSEQYVPHRRNDEPSVSFNRSAKRSRVSERVLESDLSDESDRDSDVSRKRISQANKSRRRAPKRKEVRAKSRDRSASRARSPQLPHRTMQERQHPAVETGNDRQQRNDEDRESAEPGTAHQGAHEDVEGACEPNNSNSSSTLENS